VRHHCPRRAELLLARQPVQTSPDSTTNDSFDAVSIIRRREAPRGAGRVEQFGKHDGSVDSLQRLVVHAVAAQHSDDMQ